MVTRARVLLAAVMVLIAAGAWWTFGPDGAEDAAAPTGPRSRGQLSQVGGLEPIGLDRLEAPRPEVPVGERDLFDFAPAPRARPTATPESAARVTSTPRSAPTPRAASEPGSRGGGPRLPPAQVSFIGSVERAGLQVAVLLMDERQVLTGREGELVGNRFRIVKIGIESVDIQDVGSDKVRRIPLKGGKD